jgi:hypothetical protein
MLYSTVLKLGLGQIGAAKMALAVLANLEKALMMMWILEPQL